MRFIPSAWKAFLLGFFGFRIRYHDKRGQRGDFPKEIEPYKVIAQDHAVHGRKKNEKNKEKAAPAVAHFRVMLVVFFHIAKGIDANEGADDADNKDHDNGQIVHVKSVFYFGQFPAHFQEYHDSGLYNN